MRTQPLPRAVHHLPARYLALVQHPGDFVVPAGECLPEHEGNALRGLAVLPQTLVALALGCRPLATKAGREPHRMRRPRRPCFGELVQMDASIHDWLEGRGEEIVLITMIDDTTTGPWAASSRRAPPRPTSACWGCG